MSTSANTLFPSKVKRVGTGTYLNKKITLVFVLIPLPNLFVVNLLQIHGYIRDKIG